MLLLLAIEDALLAGATAGTDEAVDSCVAANEDVYGGSSEGVEATEDAWIAEL